MFLHRFRWLVLGFVASCCLVGCATLFRGVPETVPGYTNVIIVAQSDGSLVTNVVSQPTIIITNLVKGEAFDTINAVGGVVPVYGEVAIALIGLAGTIYLGWRNSKNKKAAISTIQGVGQFRVALKASGTKGVGLDDKLTLMLKSAQLNMGVKDTVDEMIKTSVGVHDQPEAVEEVRKLL